MKIRGRRECVQCGTVWSYYETGSPRCPDCDSVRSVGLDDRTRHTDATVSLDLTPVRNRIDDVPDEDLAADAAARAREYVRERGFVDAGELEPLDWTFVGATELVHVATAYGDRLRPSNEEELYFLDLLKTADGGEPRMPDDVPSAMAGPYGLAMASAVSDYQRDLRTYLRDVDDVPTEASAIAGRLRDHRKRIEALQGDVDPADAYRLVRAARDLGRAVAGGSDDDRSEDWREGDEEQDGSEGCEEDGRSGDSAYVTADNWLSGIEGE